MGVKKLVGYLMAIIGIIILAASFFEQIRTLLGPLLPAQITELYLTIGGVIIVVVGLLLAIKDDRSRGRQKGMEVPIYHGKNIVGYRRN